MDAAGGTSQHDPAAAAAGDPASLQQEQEHDPCPHCGQADFNYEDLDEGTKLVCRECGYVLDEVVLVHQQGKGDDGMLQQTAYLSAHDDGRFAGAALLPGGAAPLELRQRRDAVLSNNRERLNNGLSFLGLPQHVATAARQLLPQVVTAYATADEGRHLVTAAVVAAVVYTAARQERHALSFGAAAAALSAPGPSVFQEYKRIKRLLELEPSLPSLDACVVYSASVVLPHYMPDLARAGPLRRQPVVQKALQVSRLVSDVSAVEGRSPWVASAAILSLCLAEAFRDAPPPLYAREVAERLSHSTVAVQQHIRACEGHLSPLLALLPYAEAGDADAGVQIVRNAGVLLKLQALSAKSSAVAAGQPGGQPAAARGSGGRAGGGG